MHLDTHRHVSTQESQSNNTAETRRLEVRVYEHECIYISIKAVTINRSARRTPTPVHSGTQKSEMETLPKAHGRSTEQSQPPENLRKDGYGELTEEKSSVPIWQHFVLPKMRDLFPYLSLSFIAQGGRPLSSVTSCLFSVISDRDTPRFSP